MSDRQHPEEKLFELVDNFRIAMLTTLEDGLLRSRPMALMDVEDDDTLWFFTSRDSEKVDEIAADHDVNLSFANERANTFISISGKAEVVRDVERQKELWNPYAKIWFEKGPADPDLVMLRVRPTQAEYWDSPQGKMVAMLGMIKALFKGEAKGEPEIGENVKVSL